MDSGKMTVAVMLEHGLFLLPVTEDERREVSPIRGRILMKS